MLTEEYKEYRVASNGGKFTVEMIDVGDEKLPLPVWSDDHRTHQEKKRQAKNNKKSRNNLYKLAEKMRNKDKDDSNNKESSNDKDNKDSNLSYSVVQKTCNILLIGLSYCRYLIDQLKNDSSVNHITQCVDINGRSIDQCVARDTC